jgi:hypothetical protein
MDQEKQANPIAEIFDEMFTLLQDLETRSVAVLEYLKEQGGATDEKLAPFLDRAAAASDVRWRAARARMDHLLAPKPKSSTDVGKEDNSKGTSQPQAGARQAASSETKIQGDKERESKPESKEVGKELASANSGATKASDSEDEKSEAAKPAADSKAKEQGLHDKKSDNKQTKKSMAGDAQSQASALGEGKNPEPELKEDAKSQSPESGDNKLSASRSTSKEKPETQKAAK